MSAAHIYDDVHPYEPYEAPTPLAPVVPAPVAARSLGGAGRRALAAMFLAGSVVGGVAGAAGGQLAERITPLAPAAPAAASPAGSRASAVPTSGVDGALVSAVSDVLPAVVTVVNKGNGGTEQSSGSGVVIDKDLGYVVTNSHVVEQSRSTQPSRFFDVILSDGTRRTATVLGNDPAHDVAVLRVEGALPAQATLADSSQVPLGAQVVAIGSPGIPGGRGSAPSLLQNSVTSGIVSAKGRSFPRADLRNNVSLTDLIQTDAAINPGNSGGPLVWVATKQVIGLNTLVVRGSGEEGLGFAVSSDTVRDIASQIISRGSAR